MVKKKQSWLDVKQRLKGMPAVGLLGVIQDLYELSGENRAFLEARFEAEGSEVGLAKFRRRVVEPFNTDGDLKFGDARKAIKDYEAATSDVGGTMDLMLTFVETGNEFTREFGDIDEHFYNALIAMLDKFAQRLRSEEGRGEYGRFAPRLRELYKRSRDFGWGYSDDTGDILEALRIEFEKQ